MRRRKLKCLIHEAVTALNLNAKRNIANAINQERNAQTSVNAKVVKIILTNIKHENQNLKFQKEIFEAE